MIKKVSAVVSVLCLGMLSCLFTNVQAADVVSPNWNLNDINSQIRSLTTSYSGTAAIVGGASRIGKATNNTMSINGLTVSTEGDPATAYADGTDVVIGGAVYHNTADSNRVSINNSTVQGRTIMGGAALLDNVDNRLETGTASGNTVFIKDSTISPSSLSTGGNVLGGFANYATSTVNNNSVTLDHSTVNESVYGAYVDVALVADVDYDSETGELKVPLNLTANDNTVRVLNGSTVNGVVVGSTGAESVSGNSVQIDASTVASVYVARNGMAYYGTGSEAVSLFSNNTVSVTNGSTVGNVYVVSGYSTNATGNKLTVDNSTVSNGVVNAVSMVLGIKGDNTPINAAISSNSVFLSNMPVGSLYEIGAGLNLAGTANSHTTALSNLAGLTVTRPTLSFGVLNIDTADTRNLLTIKDLDGNKVSTNDFDPTGFVYGATALDYVFKPTSGDEVIIANGGKEANSNIVHIANSTVHANVIGGFSGFIRENEDHSDPEDDDNATVAANNNTVILENTNFDGTVHGGFVVGGNLKVSNISTSDNTVVIRGNTTLSPTSVLYGGNAYLGRSTNRLVFDRVAGASGAYVTFSNPNQFQNFNDTWQVNADLNTRINFDFNNVNALVTVDRTDPQAGTATIIKTQTSSDLSNVEQNGVITDLIDDSVELAQSKVGIYSYSLTPQKEDATTVGWVLSSGRDHHNVETYGQLPLVGLALASEGPELLSNTMREAWKNEADRDAFVSGGYHHTRYQTGSGFDLNVGLVQAGFWKKITNDWLGGFFVKYSGGKYETYPIDASGDASAFGGGLMTSVRYSETGRVEASAQVGHLDLEFTSNELVSTMKSKGIYYGASFGIVEQVSSPVELFAHAQYLRKGDDSLTDNLGQDIHYQAMQSITLRAGTEISFTDLDWNGVVPSLGVSGIYEFDGKSKLDVMGTSNDEASMRGLSGRGEIGLLYQSEESLLPMVSKLTVFGQAGKRRGYGGELNISVQF